MPAFGGKQGGKASAHESKPKKDLVSNGPSETSGDKKMGQVPKGVGGSKRGFGA